MQNDTFNEALNYLEVLYRTARYLTRDEVEAEDLVQEVYLKAYANWNTFQQGTNCKAWLFRILYNTHINRVKKEAREPKPLPSEIVESFPAEITISAADLKKTLEELVADEIKTAIKKLPDEYIETLILAWVVDFSYTEIAGILECPIGTVMSRLHRARVFLRKNLAEYKKENRL